MHSAARRPEPYILMLWMKTADRSVNRNRTITPIISYAALLGSPRKNLTANIADGITAKTTDSGCASCMIPSNKNGRRRTMALVFLLSFGSEEFSDLKKVNETDKSALTRDRPTDSFVNRLHCQALDNGSEEHDRIGASEYDMIDLLGQHFF